MPFKPFAKKSAPPFGKKGEEKAPPFGKKGEEKKGGSAPIKRYPAEDAEKAPESSPTGSAPDASRSTNRGGKPNAPAAEPKLSPEAEAARAKQGAVTVLTSTGPAVTPPPDPRAHYQVGDEMDNTPLVSLTTLASAAQQKGNPAAALPAPKANSDLKSGGKADVEETEEVDEAEEEPEDEEPEDDEEPKKPFGRK